jgi:hypothetical protein
MQCRCKDLFFSLCKLLLISIDHYSSHSNNLIDEVFNNLHNIITFSHTGQRAFTVHIYLKQL